MSGVWKEVFSFPVSSQIPLLPAGHLLSSQEQSCSPSLAEDAEPTLSARWEKQNVPLLLPEFPPLPISGLGEDADICVHSEYGTFLWT